MLVRDVVAVDGTVHRVARPAAFWAAFDDPEQPVGATGLLTVGCGLLLRAQPDATPRRECPFCAAELERVLAEAPAVG